MIEIRTSTENVIRLQLVEYNGKDFVDIRTWISPEYPRDQKPVPTKKGIRFLSSHLPDLIEKLISMQEKELNE